MDYLQLTIARARVEIPPNVVGWALDSATPMLRAWTELLGRREVTDAQAWTLLWRDGRLERAAEKVPQGEAGYFSCNASSDELAEHISSYLARPKVPPGAIGRIREHFDGTVLARLDLLRAVTRRDGSDGSDTVTHELAAEPPVDSSRGRQLGQRDFAVVERYRNNARTEAR